jgi:hypothetical protein
MPIRKDLKGFYPIDWTELSRVIRFERAKGRCEGCGRPHGQMISHLGDGRWFDPNAEVWRDGQGRSIDWIDFSEYQGQLRRTRVVLATAHLDHNPTNNRVGNLRALCQRCHLAHDRKEHRRRRRITYRRRRALGDLFDGPYRRW